MLTDTPDTPPFADPVATGSSPAGAAPPVAAPAVAPTPARGGPGGPDTLAIDIGGTGLKASVLDPSGQMEHARVRVTTPYPLSPQKLIATLAGLIKPLPHFDRISVGFPGMVRTGQVLSAPHFISPKGPGGKPSKELVEAWSGFDLQHSLGVALGKPTRVANDADLQGAAVIKGDGLEVVLTLGTGLGTALFFEGKLLPHLELAHHPFLKGEEYNLVVGDAARKKLGKKKWNKNVAAAIDAIRALTFFDHCYVGGGNAVQISFKLPTDITVVDNAAGILGGIKLWDRVD
jgi:polyphosphate glucokinase